MRVGQSSYIKIFWSKSEVRDALIPGERSVKHNSLFKKENILQPALHINLGLMKKFVKALIKNGKGFRHLKEIFPRISEGKLKAGIVIRTNVREVINARQEVWWHERGLWDTSMVGLQG